MPFGDVIIILARIEGCVVPAVVHADAFGEGREKQQSIPDYVFITGKIFTAPILSSVQ